MLASWFFPFLLGPIRNGTLPASAVPLLSFGGSGGSRMWSTGSGTSRPSDDASSRPVEVILVTGVLPAQMHTLLLRSVTAGNVIEAATIVSYKNDAKVPTLMFELTKLLVDSHQVQSYDGDPVFTWEVTAKSLRTIKYQ